MKLKYFDLAKKISKLSTHPQFKIGCVIVKGNKVISVAFNEIKTHPKSTHPYGQLHAEISAVLDADRDELQKAEAYVYRQHWNGVWAIAKPCQYCELALIKSGIKTVHYTDNSKVGEQISHTIELKELKVR